LGGRHLKGSEKKDTVTSRIIEKNLGIFYKGELSRGDKESQTLKEKRGQ